MGERRAVKPSGLATAVCSVVCVLVSLGCMVRAAHAYVDEIFMNARDLVPHDPRADQRDASRTVVLNGLRIHVDSGGSPRPLPELLDVFHGRCRERGGRLDLHARGAPRSRAFLERFTRLPLDGVLRAEDGRSGYVACLDLGGAPVPLPELLRRTRRFLASGDVADLGDLRLVLATRSGDRTSYLSLWTDGPLPMRQAFPDGDAPGKDPPGVPRPPEARRVLSARQIGRAPAVTIYLAHGVPSAAIGRRYARAIERAGLAIHRQGPAESGFVARTADGWLLVGLHPSDEGTFVSVLPLAQRPGRSGNVR